MSQHSLENSRPIVMFEHKFDLNHVLYLSTTTPVSSERPLLLAVDASAATVSIEVALRYKGCNDPVVSFQVVAENLIPAERQTTSIIQLYTRDYQVEGNSKWPSRTALSRSNVPRGSLFLIKTDALQGQPLLLPPERSTAPCTTKKPQQSSSVATMILIASPPGGWLRYPRVSQAALCALWIGLHIMLLQPGGVFPICFFFSSIYPLFFSERKKCGDDYCLAEKRALDIYLPLDSCTWMREGRASREIQVWSHMPKLPSPKMHFVPTAFKAQLVRCLATQRDN